MFKKIITIVLPIIAVTAAIFVFGLKVYQDSFDKFQYDGFVIGSSSGKESSKYHFTKDEKYKVDGKKGEVSFTNSESEDVRVPETSFVHYTDGSISTFKKAVVLNMANVKTDSLQYYNVFNGSVFTKTSEGYQIKYLEQTLSFNNFLVKVSDTKYMLVGKNLSIKYGDKEETVADGFLEINYLDGNIVRIENQDLLLQNISTDISVDVDGIKTDLLNKKIIYNEETKVDLGEITIDSDDNIEIIPDEENTEIIDQEEKNEIADIQNQPVVAPGVDVSGMESGVIDTSVEQIETIVKDNQKIPDAKFLIESFEVESNLMTVKITIDDEKGVLKGDVDVKIIDNATNEQHCSSSYAHGQQIGTQGVFTCKTLSPGRNYSLIVASNYEKNEMSYRKDFIQRTFVTPTPGISIEEDYVSENRMAFVVKFREEMSFSKFKYTVIESEKGLSSTPIEYGVFDISIPQRIKDEQQNELEISCATSEKNGVKVEAPNGDDLSTDIKECYIVVGEENNGDEIKSNTKYSLIISEIYNKENVIIPNYQIYKTVTTLKQKPSYGSVDGSNASTVIVNKMSSEFVLYLNNLSDVNNSVINYRAEIFEKTSGRFITSYETLPSNQIRIPVGNAEQGAIISRYGEGYTAKMYLTYHDNEKEVEEYIGDQSLYMGSKEAPTVTFEKGPNGIVEFDRIKGVVKIYDPQKAIVEGSYINFKITNQSDGKIISHPLQFVRANIEDGTLSIPIDEQNLKQDTNYLFEVQAYINLGDQIITEEGEVKDVGEHIADIGSFVIKTPQASQLNVVWQNNTTQSGGKAFSVSFALTEGNDYYNNNHNKLTASEISQLTEKELELYEKAQKEYDHYEFKRLQKLKIRLRKADQVIQSDSECNPEKYCWQKEFQDEDSSLEVNTIFEQFYVERSDDSKSPTIGYQNVKIADVFKAVFCQNCSNDGAGSYDFGMKNEELDTGTYKLEVLGTIDNSDYSNFITFRFAEYQFTPNANPDIKIIKPDLYKENFIYETQSDLFEPGESNLQTTQTGYSFVPSIDRAAIKSLEANLGDDKKATLSFNYYLYDLAANKLIDLTGQNKDENLSQGKLLYYHDENLAEGATRTYGISFTREKFNEINPNNKIEPGKPIGFCYDLTIFVDSNDNGTLDSGEQKLSVGNSDEGVPSFSCTSTDRALKGEFQLKRNVPSLSSKLIKTEYVQSENATRLIFDYKVHDYHGAIYDYVDSNKNNLGKIAMYKTGSGDWQPIKCDESTGFTKTKNCLQKDGQFAVLINQNTTLATEIYYRRLDNSHEDIKDENLVVNAIYETNNPINGLELATIVEPFSNTSGIKYYITENKEQNSITFTIDGDYSPKVLKSYVVNTEIKLTPISAEGKPGTTMTLYKNFDNDDYLNSGSGTTIRPTITISNDEIGAIAGANSYNIQMRFIYNKFYLGFDQEIPSDEYIGYAVYAKRGAEYIFNDMGTGTKFFRDLKYYNGQVYIVPGTAPEDERLKYNSSEGKYKSKNSVETTVYSGAKGITYTDGDKRTNYINFARMFEEKVYCINDINKNGKIDNNEESTSCDLNVSIENPIFQMENDDIDKSLGKVTYNFKLTIPDNILKDDFVLIRNYYQTEIKTTFNKKTGESESEAICKTFDENGNKLEPLETYRTPLNMAEDEEPEVGGKIINTDYNSYSLTDEYGIGIIPKCVVFEWTGSQKDPADNEYHDINEIRSFTYGAAYHSENPTKPDREYPMNPINSVTIQESVYNYDTGTLQYVDGMDWDNQPNSRKQHKDYRRTMSYSIKTASFYDVDWFEFNIYKLKEFDEVTKKPEADDTQLIPIEIKKVYVGDGSYNDKNGILSGVFSLDAIVDENGITHQLKAGEMYVLRVTPYRYCTTGEESKYIFKSSSGLYDCKAVEGRENETKNGQQRIMSIDEVFSFDISPASVMVTRLQSVKDENDQLTPKVRIAVDDSNRTVGSYATNPDVAFEAEYFITVEIDNKIEEIASLKELEGNDGESKIKFSSATGSYDLLLPECRGQSKCVVRVDYKMDLDNDITTPTTSPTQQYQKPINMSIEADLGIISATLTTSRIELYFSSHYRPWIAKEYTYTLTPLSSDEEKQLGTGKITEWNETADSDTVLELEFLLLNRLKSNRSYSLYVKFKDEEGNQISDWQVQGLIAK